MPGAPWLAAIAEDDQAPVYFLRIDGLSYDYSTGPVKSAGTTKKVGYLHSIRGGGATVDLLTGVQTVQEVECEVLDVNDEVTDVVAVRAAGAPLTTLVNRKATLYSGFRHLTEAEYEPRFTGRIRGTPWNDNGTGYVFRLSDVGYMLDGRIMTGATEGTPASIVGNVVNVYWSLLTGTFDTGHATFPLTSVSADGATSSAPTGLGIATALINEDQLVAQRDTWHIQDTIRADFVDSEDARALLTAELFRAFQSFPAISGDGKLGLRFHVPSLPLSAAAAISEDDVVEIHSWDPSYGDHLNKFTIKGNYSTWSKQFESTLYSLSDTADQAATGETIEYLVESRWMRTEYDGANLAWELANRMKVRCLHPPVPIEVTVNAHHLAVEQGDVVRVTHPLLVDLFAGSRGVTDHMMTVLAIAPEWDTGNRRLTLLDTGGRRYGLITGDAQASYAASSVVDRETWFYISNDSGVMSDGSDGYRFI